ncbi:hypothetical protein FHS95_002141 [Sphingomonas naasensis]|uniref:Uncharacterized protein n=1 Tax=Sphingomonas naasensis TaxID=1344951 RepID=A0A4S1WRC1_9SPHN|nr:hypothetical protein [Sphingomonas naasensis]NIJ20449.1 hypothetical protein [Sphingomonas naasensis]TGX44550.1 hypothetical protein E5A74_07165 [Sphingomonas naasensis]
MSYADRDRSISRRLVGFAVFVVAIPIMAILLAIFVILKLLVLPFERPSHRSAEEVARDLRGFVDGTGGEWDFDDLTSIPLADPRLESIRERASAAFPGTDDAEWLSLAEEAEAIAAADRANLIGLLRQALGGDISGAMIDEALPYPRSLGDRETKAYAALSRWADDDDVRARNLGYTERQRAALAEQLALLSAHPAP